MDINFLLQCGTMKGTQILLDHHSNVENLKKKLNDIKLEIKQLEMDEEKETRRKEETIKKLRVLMQNVTKERDEARNHLQMLKQRFMPMNQENHSQQKSSVHVLLDSEDQSSSDTADPCNVEHNANSTSSSTDRVSQVIDDYGPFTEKLNQLLMNKPLPEKGKLFQAVCDYGKDLETLLSNAAPLPQISLDKINELLTKDGIAIFLEYQDIIKFLNLKVQETTLRMQNMRINVKEKIKRNKQKIDNLLQLYWNLMHERDVAKNEVMILQLRSAASISDRDPYSATVHQFCMDEALPEKGKLVQAVIDAGREFQSVLSARAPIPEKRKPHLLQLFPESSVVEVRDQKRKRE